MIKSKMNSLWPSLLLMVVIVMCCCSTTLGDVHLAPPGAHRCDYGVPVSRSQCEAEGRKLAPNPRRPLQVGSGGWCMDGGWGQVPLGCSVQTGGDRAAHFKTSGASGPGCAHRIYQLVCTEPGWRDVVAHEDELVNTCTNECSDIRYLESAPAMLKKNCKVVKNCQKLSSGWTRGFVRCDYCKCRCQDSRAVIPKVIEVKTRKQFKEPDLYGTCTTTCPRSGLVRTDWGGCKQVRNCGKSHNGWTKGWVRCDYCVCDCINHKYEHSYKLRNVKYSLDASSLKPGDPIALSKMPVTNQQDAEQTSSITMSFDYTNLLEVSTETSVTAGLSIAVESGVNIKAFSAKLTTTATIEAGYTTTTGKVEQESHSDSVTATVVVKPRRSCEVVLMASVMKLNIPYTADLVTVYNDNSESVTKTSGVFTGVETKQFRVLYPPCSSAAPGTKPAFTRNPPKKKIKRNLTNMKRQL